MSHRTAIELYRDLLRLVTHIAPGSSPKSIALRTMIRSEFDKSKHLSPNPSHATQIETMKANAVRALSNYMLYTSGIHDKKSSSNNSKGSSSGGGGTLGKAMDDFHERNVEELKKQK